MRGGKSDGAGLSALTNRTPRRPVTNRWHAAIQLKSRAKIKPALGRTSLEQPEIAKAFFRLIALAEVSRFTLAGYGSRDDVGLRLRTGFAGQKFSAVHTTL